MEEMKDMRDVKEMKKKHKKRHILRNVLALVGFAFIIKALFRHEQMIIINGMKVETGHIESVDQLVDDVVEEVDKQVNKKNKKCC